MTHLASMNYKQMIVSITLQFHPSYMNKKLENSYEKDGMICIDIVKTEKEIDAASKFIDYVLNHDICLLNHIEASEMIRKHLIRGVDDYDMWEEFRDDDYEYRFHLKRLYEELCDLPYICNRYSKGNFGQVNGWNIIIS